MSITVVCPLCACNPGEGTLPTRANGSPGSTGLCDKCSKIPVYLQEQLAAILDEIYDLECGLHDAKYKMRHLLLSLAGRT